MDVVADSDTTGALVALGLGGLLTGTGAADIALDERIARDPSRIAASLTGAAGDGGALLRLADAEGVAVRELSGRTLGDFYGDAVSDVGFDSASTLEALETNATLTQSLELRAESISGVNVDEELVDLLEYEQAFEAASRYINVLNDLNDEILALL